MTTALESARTALREALDASAAVKFLRESRAGWADAWARARSLSADEVAGLETRGNRADSWNAVKVLGDGGLDGIENCRFQGEVVLRTENGAPTLTNSRIRNCLIGAARIENCALICRAWIEDGAFLRNIGELRGAQSTRFVLGRFLRPGSETGARKVFLVDGLRVSDCAAMAALTLRDQDVLTADLEKALQGLEATHSYVGAKSRIEHVPVIEDCFFGPGSTVRAAQLLQGSVFASTLNAPVHAAEGAIVAHSVLDAGVGVHFGAQVHNSLLLEFSGADRAAHVADSVLGPGTVAAKGEITASLVGPFVGFHHQSLLIGALWPEGRGNIAYGANVGSNHTGRKPDQELRPGEGTFFGLGCVVKFPGNYEDAPYSLFASGATVPPQRLAFPFSLVAPATEADAPGLNEILPGWMWSDNAYALVRNAYKYADRHRAQRHAVPALTPPAGSPLEGTFLASDLFAPALAERVLRALDAFPRYSLVKSKGVYLADEIEGLGANFLRGARLKKARAAYQNYLTFALCRMALWNPSETLSLSETGRPLLKALDIPDMRGLDVDALFAQFASSVELSLTKDTVRGREIFADYEAFHGAPSEDPVCRRLYADIARVLPPLSERLR